MHFIRRRSGLVFGGRRVVEDLVEINTRTDCGPKSTWHVQKSGIESYGEVLWSKCLKAKDCKIRFEPSNTSSFAEATPMGLSALWENWKDGNYFGCMVRIFWNFWTWWLCFSHGIQYQSCEFFFAYNALGPPRKGSPEGYNYKYDPMRMAQKYWLTILRCIFKKCKCPDQPQWLSPFSGITQNHRR